MGDCESKVRNIIYDDDNIVRAIQKSPHTYYSLLDDYYKHSTFQLVLRRRVKRLIKQNRVWRIRVPGTRFGMVVFLYPERDYTVITKNSSRGVNVYYCHDFAETDNNIILTDYWELKGSTWNKWLHKTERLSLLKTDGREGGLIIW